MLELHLTSCVLSLLRELKAILDCVIWVFLDWGKENLNLFLHFLGNRNYGMPGWNLKMGKRKGGQGVVEPKRGRGR